jgi:hypothetical protein
VSAAGSPSVREGPPSLPKSPQQGELLRLEWRYPGGSASLSDARPREEAQFWSLGAEKASRPSWTEVNLDGGNERPCWPNGSSKIPEG